MKKALIFIGGLVSGIVLTILALVIVSYYSNSNSDYSFWELYALVPNETLAGKLP